jgi:hypothetical protein
MQSRHSGSQVHRFRGAEPLSAQSLALSSEPLNLCTSEPSGNGNAHDRHFATAIAGSAAQHPEQHEAVRFRHGSSRSQTTQEACRTIRAVSRPNMDSVCNTAQLYFEGRCV